MIKESGDEEYGIVGKAVIKAGPALATSSKILSADPIKSAKMIFQDHRISLHGSGYGDMIKASVIVKEETGGSSGNGYKLHFQVFTI